ncbi:MAG: hypothetical protein ACUVWJ_06550, partial [Spirochaetota bacterium]
EEKKLSMVEGFNEEEETIALSKDELDNILSEAEIIHETSEPGRSKESGISETEESEELKEEPKLASGDEEEFDISGEIDELSPEDLENIELEESELESFTKELEAEVGGELKIEELEIPEEGEAEIEPVIEKEQAETSAKTIPEETLESIETPTPQLETRIDEEIDLETYLSSVKEELDLESIEIEEEELTELPILGEEEKVIDIQTGEAFKEAGIEGVEEESVTLDEAELEDIEKMTLEEEVPAGETTIEEAAPEGEITELEIEKLPPEIGKEMEDLEKPFKGEIILDEKEEKILSEDFDLSEGAVEEVETEDIVSVKGEELEALGLEEEAAKPVAEPTIEGTVEIGGEELAAVTGKEEPLIDYALFNDIKTILKFMDSLLGDLPEEKIKEFSRSEYFPLYKQVFEKLNIT